jgi:ABC-type nitrate/sulfonate/bicarbonate transport system substrate-binding protein
MATRRLEARAAGWLVASGLVALALVALALAIGAAQPAVAQPEIRMGVGPVQEEQLWLIRIRPDLTPNQGKAYRYRIESFLSSNEKIRAIEGGQLDGASASTSAILFAASKGIGMTVTAVQGQESNTTSSSSYMALADSDISLQNLKGKVIGLGGYRSSFELVVRMAVKQAGLDPDRDVKWQLVPFPQMGAALRARKVDLGIFPTAFAYRERRQGGVKTLFTTASFAGLEEEYNVFFAPAFIAKNREAVRAWSSDFVAVTRYLIDNQREARQAILDAKLVQMDPKLYIEMTAKDDLNKIPDGKPDVAMWARLQEMFIDAGFQDKRLDIGTLVDTSLLPSGR